MNEDKEYIDFEDTETTEIVNNTLAEELALFLVDVEN